MTEQTIGERLEAAVWEKLQPFIANEDLEYSEEAFEELTADVLPKVFSAVSATAEEIGQATTFRHNTYENKKPLIHLKIKSTTRGPTWGVTVENAGSPQEALDLYQETEDLLMEQFGIAGMSVSDDREDED